MSTPSKISPQDVAKRSAVEEYDRIVASARMQDIRLVKYEFEVKPQYYEAAMGEANSPPKLSFDHSFASIQYSAPDKALLGEIHWTISAKVGRTTPLKINAIYLVTYTDVPEVETPHAEAFMKRVGRFAAYPYFRSLVAQTSWAAVAELPILPILR